MYRSRFLAQVMKDLHYDAAAVGERDLTFGLVTLRDEAKAGPPIICANLYAEGARAFAPSVVRKVGGVKVGVFALLGEEPRDLEGFEIKDPAAEGRVVLAKLRKECDYVILLAHMDRPKLLALIPKLRGVDLVIRGHYVEGEKAHESCVDTLVGVLEKAEVPILFAGQQARNVGSVAISVKRGGGGAVTANRLIRLGADVGEDTSFAARVGSFMSEESLRERQILLNKSLTRDESTGRIRERYLGYQICGRCHDDLVPRYLLTRHFKAFDTLREKGKETSPDCLACHTTGYGKFGGYDAKAEEEGGPYLRGVQCEACHGPGTTHARDGSYVRSARASCTVCHTLQWSPHFDYETYWKRVSHRGSVDSTKAR